MTEEEKKGMSKRMSEGVSKRVREGLRGGSKQVRE